MISIVVPLYNKEKFVFNTMQSVLKQTFQLYEIIIVDDESTDRSLDIVKSIQDERIRIFTQKNQGVSAARNHGIAEAKYDYIALLDADDEWQPDYLETQVKLINSYPQCAVFACAYNFQYPDGEIRPFILNKMLFTEGTDILRNYFEVASCSNPPLWTSAVVARKDAILSVGGFPVGVTSGEDLAVWAKLAFHYLIAYDTKPSATFVLDPAYLVSNKPTRLHDEIDYVANELISLYRKASGKQKKDIKKYVSMWYKMRASIFVRIHDKKRTLQFSFYSLKYNAWNWKVYFFMVLVFLPAKLQATIKDKYEKGQIS